MNARLIDRFGILRVALFICFAGILAFSAEPVHAVPVALSQAQITLNASLFSTTNGMELSWYGQSTQAVAWAQHPSGQNLDFNFSMVDGWQDISVEASYYIGPPYYYGIYSLSESSLQTGDRVIRSFSTAIAQSPGSFKGDALTYVSGFFTVTGTGTVSFSVDYSLYQLLYNENVNEVSSVYSAAGIYLFSVDSSGKAGNLLASSGWEGTMVHTLTTIGTEDFTKEDTLTVSYDGFIDGQTGYFLACVTSPAMVAVSEPATMLLLGLGLMGLAGFRRMD
jgi:hypothetical protein